LSREGNSQTGDRMWSLFEGVQQKTQAVTRIMVFPLAANFKLKAAIS